MPVELGFPRFLGLERLSGDQWLLCIGYAIALTLVYEVMKLFLRRGQSSGQMQPAPAVAASKAA